MGLKRRALPAYALTLMLAASPVMPAAADTRGTAVAIPSAAKIRIDNFGQVNAHYYRGAQPIGRDYADLAALGVTTVIDLQKDGDPNEKSLVEKAGMTFYRIPMTTREAPTSDQIAQFMRLVSDSENQTVYVHCAGGRHRTGVMTAVYRMERDGWTPSQAFAEMKRYKFGLDFLHPEFKDFVYGYHHTNMLARSSS